MIIDKEVSLYLKNKNESLINALAKIEVNEVGSVVLVDDEGKLSGILTDGDFRRWVLSGGSIEVKVSEVMNKDWVSAKITDSPEKISMLIDDKTKFIPLVDRVGRCVAIAKKRTSSFKIGDRLIGEGHGCFVIAEIGNNHNGSIDTAYELVDQAVDAGADCAKFQMRDLSSLYGEEWNAFNPSEDLGSQYTIDLLSRFQLTNDDLFRVFDYCESKGIIPLCTPWDIPSIGVLEKYGVKGYKSASADFTNHDLLSKLAATGKPIISSTGMTNDNDIKDSIGFLKKAGAEFALLHCNSTYPTPFKDINLRYMLQLKRIGECAVGYSSHDRGINICVGAVALGANIIEKHFTLDRNMEGNDHKVSLLPGEFSDMVVAIKQLEQSLCEQNFRSLSQGELMNREILGKSLVINTTIEKGEIIEYKMLDVRSPGKGLLPNQKELIVGKPAGRRLKCGDMLFLSDTKSEEIKPRSYNFKHKYGIPVRYHDLKELESKSNFDLLEFHLSYKDMELDPGLFLDRQYEQKLIVHAPELYPNDHILDLCALDADYRTLSIQYLNSVVDITRKLSNWFKSSVKPKLIVNVGGFSYEKPLDINERNSRYQILLESLEQIDKESVEILPQTMPPFPWHFGGQRHQNLFIDANEIVKFSAQYGYRVCFDISHSKLACNHFCWSFSEFTNKVLPYSAHLHIADASGEDGEGLQIFEGDIDFQAFFDNFKHYAPTASFIPEVWQGHKNGGEGFWIALDRLEKVFSGTNKTNE